LVGALVLPAAIVSVAVDIATNVLANSDIIMPSNSDIMDGREIGSHEYGHYSLCDMMQESNSNSIDNLIFDFAANAIFNSGPELSQPLRYINEAWADFISGQVTSIANYRWLGNAFDNKVCFDPTTPCYDQNRTGTDNPDIGIDSGRQQIARIATLFQDVFDGHGMRTGNAPPADGAPSVSPTNAPGDDDAWMVVDPTTPIFDYSQVGYGDFGDEHVALPGTEIRTLAHHIADGLNPLGIPPNIDDAKVYAAINQTMVDNNVSWCDRCQVFALHSATGANPPPSVGGSLTVDQVTACLTDSRIANALGPSQASTCVTTCPTDAVINGNTAGFGTFDFDVTVQAPNDICPDVFVLEVDNPQGFFAGTNPSTGLKATFEPPMDQASCQTSYSLIFQEQQGGTFLQQSVMTSTGTFTTNGGGVPGSSCTNLPTFSFSPTNVPSQNLRFQTPVVAGRHLEFSAAFNIP
jgi:hypothetical protein